MSSWRVASLELKWVKAADLSSLTMAHVPHRKASASARVQAKPNIFANFLSSASGEV